jgi:transposase
MKSILVQFGVHNFNPALRKAPEKLESLRTPEGIPLPSNAVAALHRQMGRFRVIKEQIKAVERTRLQRLQRDPAEKFNAMVSLLVRIMGLTLRQPNNSCMRFCPAIYATARRWRVMRG